jgi:hypothetical protein
VKAPTRAQLAATELARPPAAPVPDPNLTDPIVVERSPLAQSQSLAQGTAGLALARIERAHNGRATWRDAHEWVTKAASGDISADLDTGLMLGVTAIAFLLHAAGADGTPRYGPALTVLDPRVTALAHRRLDLAHARIDRGELPAFAEYDLLHGLTGIGAHLLRNDRGGDALGRILTYLVRLTRPVRVDGDLLPGWWTSHDPAVTQSAGFPGGHGNLGIAHGVTGPLALLAQARRAGITIDGHTDAMNTICAWLDTWRHDDGATGAWWPQWITRQQHRTGQPDQHRPLRPSWCYGTPGLARAQQLAGIATGDTARQQMAEDALAGCLSDPDQLGQLIDASLCHGWAGLYQTTWRAARDALTPALDAHLPHLADRLTEHGAAPADLDQPIGFLDGGIGHALAFDTSVRDAQPVSGWDAALLIN